MISGDYDICQPLLPSVLWGNVLKLSQPNLRATFTCACAHSFVQLHSPGEWMTWGILRPVKYWLNNNLQFNSIFIGVSKRGVDFKAPNNVAEEVSQSPAAPTSKWEKKSRLRHPFAGCWKCRSCSPNRHTHCMNPLNSYPRDKLWIGVIWLTFLKHIIIGK